MRKLFLLVLMLTTAFFSSGSIRAEVAISTRAAIESDAGYDLTHLKSERELDDVFDGVKHWYPSDRVNMEASLYAAQYELWSQGIKTAKVYLFRSERYLQAWLSLHPRSAFSHPVTWWFRIALAVYVGDEIYVIDRFWRGSGVKPLSRPIGLDEWVKRNVDPEIQVPNGCVFGTQHDFDVPVIDEFGRIKKAGFEHVGEWCSVWFGPAFDLGYLDFRSRRLGRPRVSSFDREHYLKIANDWFRKLFGWAYRGGN